MSGWAEPIKPGVLTATDLRQYRQIPEAGAFLAGAVANGRTKMNVGFVISPGASTVCNVEVRLLNYDNKLINTPRVITVLLTDANGILTSLVPSGAVSGINGAYATSGALIGTLTAKIARMVQTIANGTYTFSITDSAKSANYVAVVCPVSGLPILSRQLVTADYGA
jgi:hypothetical protein